MSAHSHWSTFSGGQTSEMIAWNNLSRSIHTVGEHEPGEEPLPSDKVRTPVVNLAKQAGEKAALEAQEMGDEPEALEDSSYGDLLEKSQTILLRMCKTPLQSRAIREILDEVRNAYDEGLQAKSTPSLNLT